MDVFEAEWYLLKPTSIYIHYLKLTARPGPQKGKGLFPIFSPFFKGKILFVLGSGVTEIYYEPNRNFH